MSEGKVIILGDPGSGKTSLVGALLGSDFIDEKPATRGLEISDWKINVGLEEKAIMHVFDFGGQQIYHSLYNVFLTDNCIVVVVIDSRREGEQKIEDWLEFISIHCENPIVFLAYNKTDMGVISPMGKGVVSRYPFISGIHFTSAKTGQGIDNLKADLIKSIASLPYLNAKVPDNWSKIKSKIVSLQDNYIPYKTFARICAENNVTKQEKITLILNFLISSGAIFYNGFGKSLSSLIILNPAWLFKEIALIFDLVHSLNKNGFFSINELKKNSKLKSRHAEVIAILLSLMQEKNLCFQASSNEELYAFPAFLPVQEPYDVNNFKTPRAIKYLYQFVFNPQILIEQFIAATFNYSSKAKVWKFGTILAYKGCLAMVRADARNKKIEVTIQGPDSDGKNLLGIIRNNMEQLLSAMQLTEVTELIPYRNNINILIDYRELRLLDKRGVQQFPKIHEGSIVTINVRELLDDIEPEKKVEKPFKLFIIAAPEDKKLGYELGDHLAPLSIARYILRSPILENLPYTNRAQLVEERIQGSDIVLILLSANLFASDDSMNALFFASDLLAKNGKPKIIPVVLRPCLWAHIDALNTLQVLPISGQPVSSFADRDAAWVSVIASITRIIRRMRNELTSIDNLLISKLSIENLTCIESLEINLENENKSAPGMFSLILGENGVGKSTILKSIILGLCNESEVNGLLRLMPGQLLANGANSGKIVIELITEETKEKYKIETFFSRTESGEISISKNASEKLPEQKLFICGYGAGRSSFGTEDVDEYSPANASLTLFDYRARLQNPELSFRRIQAEGISLEASAKKLDEILMIEPGSTTIGSNGIKINGPWGGFVPIGGLSDGYRATIAWISDLIGWSCQFNSDTLEAGLAGIVLIDEIEQHLHPRWQRVIVKILREQFPKIQFIATTHTPLVASGAADFEDAVIASIERNSNTGKVNLREISPSAIGGKTINKVLLDVFGLLSSISPKFISFVERYTFLASKADLSQEERNELNALAEKLDLDINFDITGDNELRDKVKKYL